MRRVLVSLLVIVAVAPLSGCGAPKVDTAPPTSPASLGNPFDTLAPGKIRDLAVELARFDHAPPVPSVLVAGEADGAYAGARARPQGIWIHYAKGIYLSIDRAEFDARAIKTQLDATGLTHQDGTPQANVEDIGGRETLVVTGGPLQDSNGAAAHRDAVDTLSWNQDGWHYLMTSRGSRHASLSLMKRVAASVE